MSSNHNHLPLKYQSILSARAGQIISGPPGLKFRTTGTTELEKKIAELQEELEKAKAELSALEPVGTETLIS